MSLRRIIRLIIEKICPAKLDTRGGALQIRHYLKRFTRQDLEELIIKYNMETNKGIDWFVEACVFEKEVQRLTQILSSEYHTKKDIDRAKHVADLEFKVKRLKEQIREMQLKAEEFNRLLYATGYIVHCTGCEAGAPYKAEELTEEKVATVEHLAQRLRSWWNTHEYRKTK